MTTHLDSTSTGSAAQPDTPWNYATNGASPDDVLAMFYCVPLAPYYLDTPDAVIRPDGRVHGNFPSIPCVFVFTPSDIAPWREAYAAQVALFKH